MPREFAVIGMGQFGRSVARHLVREGNAVLAIDINRDRANLVEADVDAIVVADATNEAALGEIGLERMGCVVVAVGVRARDTSIMVTALLRQRGIPKIVSRASDDLHARVLLTVGAHEVINPEADMGIRLARHLSQPMVDAEIVVGPEEIVASVQVPELIVGLSPQAESIVPRFNVEILAVTRGDRVISTPFHDERLESGDRLVILGSSREVRKFAALM